MFKYFRSGVLAVSLVLISTPIFSEVVWVDVRSGFEHKLSHIEGDLHIPHAEIVEKISKVYPDKTTEIKLYCLSGGRSGTALKLLQAAGYTKVSNAGGISEVRSLRKIND